MKEATGELNMTVITVVAIAAIAGIFYAWIWPAIQVSIAKNTCKASCEDNSGCDSINITEIKKEGFDATSFCTGKAPGAGTTPSTTGGK